MLVFFFYSFSAFAWASNIVLFRVVSSNTVFSLTLTQFPVKERLVQTEAWALERQTLRMERRALVSNMNAQMCSTFYLFANILKLNQPILKAGEKLLKPYQAVNGHPG